MSELQDKKGDKKMTVQQEIMQDIRAEDAGLKLLVEDREKDEQRFSNEISMAFNLLVAMELERAAKALALGIVQTHRAMLQRKEDSSEQY